MHPTRISWGTIFAGVLLASMAYLFLGVLGTALGAGSFDPLGRHDPFAGFGTGAGIWLGLSTLVSLAVGGFFAGRPAIRRGTLHGVLSGAVSILVTLYLLAGVGRQRDRRGFGPGQGGPVAGRAGRGGGRSGPRLGRGRRLAQGRRLVRLRGLAGPANHPAAPDRQAGTRSVEPQARRP
ncbi:MAG: hypothetical protein VB138_08480 [Burkholderia sp.]